MTENTVPQNVLLRDERVRLKPQLVGRDSATEEISQPYVYRRDEELEAIIVASNGNSLRALEKWFLTWRHRRRYAPHVQPFGVHLIPGRLQLLLGLPVRQVYVHYQSIYLI